ncbi:MAG TPA: carboxypeptidase regulatory-like domain-containing protein [Candidatus Angelobacter sp.]|nr:carboxypeptidase regulatory-like domain-containing protein [Candidatus Angelobacter sp.]
MKNILASFLLLLVFAGCKSQPSSQPSSSNSSSNTAEAAPPSSAPVATPDLANAGSIKGAVDFKGALPRVPTIDMTADPMCPQTAQPAETAVVKNGKLANVFVYVKEGAPAGPYPVPSEPVVLDQKNCRYSPHMMGVMAKQPFKITNTDQADHNIHDMPSKNPAWNETQMPTDKPIVKSFTTPEMMIALQCNQHPWMRAYVNVMSNPYYAVTGPDGSFEIKNLPPGEYTLAAVHEKFGEKTMKVKVEPKQAAKADFEFSAAR